MIVKAAHAFGYCVRVMQCRPRPQHPARPRRVCRRVLVAAAAAVTCGAGPVATALVTAPGAVADTPPAVGGPMLATDGITVDTAPMVPPLPPTSATSFVVADADTGAVLAAHGAHVRLAPASTLKTLTALTLIPKLAASATTVALDDAPRVDGTKAGIVAGTTYKIGDLFTAMLMMSANDAAVALADANGGLAPTLAEMNAEAAHLQADDTTAMTPDGLDAAGQASSAYDLALIFRAGLANAAFRGYLAQRSAAFPAPGGTSFQIQTHDKLLAGYPGMVGGKNGYTVAAQASYVGAATRNGHTIIVAVMRDQPNFWDEVKALLDWGFAADGVASPVGNLVGPAPAPGVTSRSDDRAAYPRPTAAAAAAGVGVPGDPAVTSAGGRNRQAASGLRIAGLSWPALAAVAAGAVVLLIALGRFGIAQRRRRSETDTGYLAGLSRLSAIREVSRSD
jgi:D-alanyl-D-alanine carboxypeptidase (penicillin-binding protein 5/6)